MESVFSVDEISEQYWPAAGRDESCKSESKMNRSASEWAFQKFLQEAAEAADTSKPSSSSSSSSSSSTTVDVKLNANIPLPLDSEDYHAILKTKLNLACAAVALTRGSLVKSQDPATLPDGGSQASNPSEVGPQDTLKGLNRFIHLDAFYEVYACIYENMEDTLKEVDHICKGNLMIVQAQ